MCIYRIFEFMNCFILVLQKHNNTRKGKQLQINKLIFLFTSVLPSYLVNLHRVPTPQPRCHIVTMRCHRHLYLILMVK